tara:strand:- start:3862 stop:4053 length:192 start_codon:yes stop_codon:yes gene_type:complete
MKLEKLNKIVEKAKEKNIDIKNTPEGKKKLEKLKSTIGGGKKETMSIQKYDRGGSVSNFKGTY